MKILCSEVKGFYIQQNWNVVRKAYSHVAKHGSIPERTKEAVITTKDAYTFAQIGDVSDTWDAIGGKNGMILFPWYNSFLKHISGLRFDGVSYNILWDDVATHYDRPMVLSRDDIEPSERQCKMNYIISCDDSDAKTIVWDRNDTSNTQEYPSTPDKAFILDINYDHKVNCKGQREFLSFRFCNSLEEVKEYFEEKGPFIYGQ
jgi:hypothetical protein